MWILLAAFMAFFAITAVIGGGQADKEYEDAKKYYKI